MTGRELVEAMTRCRECKAHNSHDVCEIDWYRLAEWVDTVEGRFAMVGTALDEAKP
jgi:hypothetical protein